MRYEPKPLVPVNPEGLDDIARSLLEETVQRPAQNISTATDVKSPEHYIILPGKKHESYSYPDVLVSMHRLGYSPEVERAAKTLGLALGDTAEEKGSHKYVGKINWEQAIRLNLALGNITLNPRQFIDFLQLLKTGASGQKVYDGRGKQLDKSKVETILDEIVTVRDPWRSEWLDARFTGQDNDNLNINYGHKLVSGNLNPQYTEKLEPHLRNNSKVDLDSFNRQGLGTKEGNDINFWYPVDGSVAGFDANSGGAGLGCYGNPQYSNSALGVRPCRVK